VKNTTKRYTGLSQVPLIQPRKATGKKGTLYIEEEMAGQTLAVNVHIDSSPPPTKKNCCTDVLFKGLVPPPPLMKTRLLHVTQ
jgi:hypothetical protein